MAAIRIKSNIGVVSERIKAKLDILKDKEYLLRPVCFDVIELMTKRIHVDGKNASEQQIGSYQNAYLKLRQKKHSRSADKKIIVSLTRQLENDWSVIATQNGYGVGFLNAFNLQKARWVEENKNQKIFSLSKSEQDHALNRIQELVKTALNDK
jgi:hypothetical protein